MAGDYGVHALTHGFFLEGVFGIRGVIRKGRLLSQQGAKIDEVRLRGGAFGEVGGAPLGDKLVRGHRIAERAAKAAQAAEAARKSLTISQLIELWLAEGPAANPNKRAISWAHDASRLRSHIIPLLGHIQAGALKRAEIEDAQARIAVGETARVTKTKKHGLARVRGGRTVARGAIVSLSSCMSWAVQREILDDNPVRRVKKEKPRTRQRFLTEAEAQRLLAVIDAMEAEGQLLSAFGDIFRVLLFTGARRGEIQRLAWAELFDLDAPARARIVLPRERSKTGEKVIALGRAATAILAARPRVGPYVFASPRDRQKPIEGLKNAWGRTRARADLADLRLHDLRHSFASFAAAGGASLPSSPRPSATPRPPPPTATPT